ncbi:hypothetical protein F7725_019680 [Dissostichus mawsoni]|uniref:Uncharacterized protein n=1 Tax=Dissostichus mawsoni TaxID=36200 RepID=A0A7J5YLT5_DISMA|nr:hypothetical protein F7725_019680 [Dissostichus mawsoni]
MLPGYDKQHTTDTQASQQNIHPDIRFHRSEVKTGCTLIALLALYLFDEIDETPPKRHGLWRLHCRELTVICCDCCTATATTCTASYISAASVCGQEGEIIRHFYNTCQYIYPHDL